jgi:hypothetical protein
MLMNYESCYDNEQDPLEIYGIEGIIGTNSTSILSFFSISSTSSIISPVGQSSNLAKLASDEIPNFTRTLSQIDAIVSFTRST